MGTRAAYYQTFATKLAATGVRVITVDQRGNGAFSIEPSRDVDFGYEELVHDIKEVAEVVKQWFPESTIHAIGHSLGGQIASLAVARYSELFESLVLMASCNVHYKNWPKKDHFKVKIGGRYFYTIAKWFGYFPGKYIGIGWQESRSVMRDWCNNVMSGTYILPDSDFDYEAALGKCKIPVQSFSIANDFLGTEAGVRSLVAKFSASGIHKHIHVDESMAGVKNLDHFSWVQHPDFFIKSFT